MDVETSNNAADNFHGRFADDGDIRIESSSLMDGGESPQETLQRVRAEHSAPSSPDTPTAFDTGSDPGDEQDPPKPAEPESADEKPKKGTARWRHDELQARIHASTRELHEVRGQLQAEERRLAELRAQAESLSRGVPAKPSDGAAPPAIPAPADDQAPQWDGKDGYEEQGKSFSQFMADHAEWTKRQAIREVKAEQERIAAEQSERESKTRTEEQDRQAEEVARARVRDIIQTLNQEPEVAAALQDPEFLDMPQTPFMGALVKLHAKGPDVLRHLAMNPADGYAFANLEMTPPIMEAFRGTDDPVRLLSALANNIPEAQRIARLSPYQAIKALAALEGSPSPGAKSGTPAPTTRQPLPSPLPAKVGARSAATVSPLSDLASNTDHADEYFRRRMAGEDVTA